MIIVDRIEEGIAVIECDGSMLKLPLSELPDGVREGSVLVRTESGYRLDPEEEQRRRKALSEKANRLFGKK